jgi:hypothetical protein
VATWSFVLCLFWLTTCEQGKKVSKGPSSIYDGRSCVFTTL